MWKLVGMTMLLSRAVLANINEEENAYYLSEREEEDRSLEGLDNSRGTTPEVTRLEEDEDEPSRKQQPENQSLDYSQLKSQPVRSIVRMNLRERTSKLRQAPAPVATLLYWPERQDQALRMNARQNPLIQDRRNPSFSPWGGKRDLERYKTITKIRRPVRVPFNSWGGKRNSEKIRSPLDDLKRNKFINWEGKKSPPFNSWGGKRGSIEFHQSSYDESSNRPNDSEDDFRKEPFEMDDDFSNIRGQLQHRKNLVNNETEQKRGSLKLIGSGQITTSGSTVHDHFARVPFEPWGGKRRSELQFSDDDPRSPSLSLFFRKIGQLFP